VRKALAPPKADLAFAREVAGRPLGTALGWPAASVEKFLYAWYGGRGVAECLEEARGACDDVLPGRIVVDGIYQPHRLVIFDHLTYEVYSCDGGKCAGRFMVEVRRDASECLGRPGWVFCPYCGVPKQKKRRSQEELALLP
jgi:hypothetical protein